MKKEKTTLLLLALIPTAAANAAQSASNTVIPFVGVKAGMQWANDDSYLGGTPHSGVAGIYGGLQFTPNWSWDIGYQYLDTLEADKTRVNLTTSLIETAVRYDWYLQQDISLYGRAGIGFWDLEKEQGVVSSHEQGVSPLYEVGANIDLSEQWRINAGYQGIIGIGNSTTGQFDSHAAILGVSYRFGNAAPLEAKAQAPEPTSRPTTAIEEAPVTEPLIVESADTPPPPLTEPALLSKVQFSFESDEMSGDAALSFSEALSLLNDHPNATVNVIGHADSTGSKPYNQTLSLKRAKTVAAALHSLGVNNQKIVIVGVGEIQPIASNKTEAGRAENRRVEVYATP